MSTSRADRSKKPYSRPAPRPRRSDGDWVHDKAPGAAPARQNAPAVASTGGAAPNTKLQVSNLHYEVTPRDLTQVFGIMGTLVREPLIRYDRSGRSTGIAIISYETAAEAKRALAHYNGKLCKGQPMTIEFDSGPPPRARRASAPTLINRIQKPNLLDRLGGDDSQIETTRASTNGAGPVRTKRGDRKPAAPREKKARAQPKSAHDLDAELDAFMKDDSVPAAAAEAAVLAGEDVEMK
ncbi:RNA-binding domain-containing protein [Phanerochaete sordida]|uniref:RNA-binding domain-containing protein n=1 Tax=Phanerochaete sordida TaxID=48140 RepID=A0A9P3GN95_9APHY|nr:RNA-binding domain-containing protein [Phanerochaete sordida]